MVLTHTKGNTHLEKLLVRFGLDPAGRDDWDIRCIATTSMYTQS